VSLFVLSSEIEDRDEVEVATGRSTRRPSTLNVYTMYFIFKMITKKKSDMNSFVFFCCSYSEMTIFKVLPSSFVVILLVLEGSTIGLVKSTKTKSLFFNVERPSYNL
jgi:hypothetical protein